MKTDSRKKTGIWLFYIAAVLIPCVYMLLWYAVQGHSFLAAKPYYSDELGYWREMFSFSQCGFGFGKGESFAGYDAPTGNLGCHGIAPLLTWGWYALIFPWKDNSLFIANFVMLTVSIAVLVFLVKPDRKQMLFILPALLLYAPAALYINTCMMEIACSSAVIVYTALYLRWREKKEKSVFVLAVIFGVYLAGVRIMYAMLLLPLLWEKVGFGLNKKTVGLFVCFAAGTLGLYALTSRFIAPYPWGFVVAIRPMPLGMKLSVILSHLWLNTKAYFLLCLTADTDAAFRWLYLAVIVLFAIDGIKNKENRWRSISVCLVYIAILFSILLLYDIGQWRDYRIMFPALLFAVLIVMTDRKMLRGAKGTVLVLTAIAFLITFRTVVKDRAFVFEERFEPSPDNRAAFSEVFGDEIASTVIMDDGDGGFDQIKDIPPQIGVRWLTNVEGVIDSDTEFIMTDRDDREVAPEYEFIGRPAEKCYVYKRTK